jgi:hypothetical protein
MTSGPDGGLSARDGDAGNAMTLLKLEGVPPFALPVLQGAGATSADDTVQMTVYVLAPEQGHVRTPIHLQMTWKTAQRLAEALRSASIEAEAAAAKRN